MCVIKKLWGTTDVMETLWKSVVPQNCSGYFKELLTKVMKHPNTYINVIQQHEFPHSYLHQNKKYMRQMLVTFIGCFGR